MNRRKTITPQALPRQAEVISLAAYRGLRSTHHTTETALEIIRGNPEFVADAEERFARTYARRLETKTAEGTAAQVYQFNKYGFKVGDLVTGKIEYQGSYEKAVRITAIDVDEEGDCALAFGDREPIYDAQFFERVKGGAR